jgi:hypothetical protein
MSESTVIQLRAGSPVMGIIPTNVEEVFRLANAIHKSGMAPSSFKTPEQITIAIIHGLEIGLPPMTALNGIAVVNGRPTLFGSVVAGLLLSKGFRLDERIEGTGQNRFAVCRVIRKDGTVTERRFSVADAIQAGLWGKAGPWKQYPDRMLAMRARGFAARDGAADALAGLYIAEEMQDVAAVDITPPRKSSAAAKRDGTKETFDHLMKAIEAAPEASDLMTLRQEHADEWSAMPGRWANLLNEAFFYRAKDFQIEVDPETGAIVEAAEEA